MSLKAALLVAACMLSGCTLLGAQGPTDVARGEYYAAGKPAFDSFFIQLHELQVELLEAPNEPQRARKNLTLAVGLLPEASDDSLNASLREELKKLEAQGLRVRLDVPDSSATDASATLYTSDSSVPSRLRTDLAQESTRLVRSRNRMRATKTRLDKLRVTGVELEGTIETEFRTDGPWKRDEVRRNLSDGQKLITLMQARAQNVEEQARKLLELVAGAATTDANLGKPVAYIPPPPEPPAAKPSSRRTGTRPPTAPRPAAAAVKPAPAGSPPRDEAAAPKPVQGNAPAEIEP